MKLDLSETGPTRVWAVAVLGSLGVVVFSVVVTIVFFPHLDAVTRNDLFAVDVIAPIAIGFPVLFLLMTMLRRLGIAHREMTRLAATDSLTAVLSRGAFTMLVEAYLEQARTVAGNTAGALLVVDADHFKAINDVHGHDRGDDALRLIAGSIRGVLRGADLVGRMGGEEFGVFLPGSDARNAENVAERIRAAVGSAEFAPGGRRTDLSVSVGGVTFASALSFAELYHMADRHLYAAKAAGRNSISLGATGLAAAA